MHLLLLFTWLSSATAQPAPPTDLAWAAWEQTDRPDWTRRLETARAQTAAREGFFSGTSSLELAFPGLVDARLGSTPVVRGRISALQSKAREREAERMETLDFGEVTRTLEAEQLRGQALDAEELAEAPLRRLLTRLEAHLMLSPELADRGLAIPRASLQAIIDQPAPTEPTALQAHDLRVATADRELAAWKRLQRQARLSALGQQVSVDPTDDLALLDTDRAPQAVARLIAGTPWHPSNLELEVKEGLEDYAQGPALSAAQAMLDKATALGAASPAVALLHEEAKAEVVRLELELTRIESQIAALPADDPRQAFLPVHLAAAQVALQSANTQLEVVVEDHLREEESEAAARRRREAQAAVASAIDDETKAQAALLSSAADAGERLVALHSTIRDLENDTERQRAADQAELDAFAQLLDKAEISSSLVGVSDLDSQYGKLRTHLIDLQESETARGEGITKALEWAGGIRSSVLADRKEVARMPAGPAATEWSRSLDKELAAAEELTAIANQIYTEQLAHIRALADKRRSLRGYINNVEHGRDQATWLHEVKLELGVLQPALWTLIAHRVQQIALYPTRLIANGKLMADLGVAALWMLVLFGAWSWARSKSAVLSARLAMQLRRFQTDLRPMDLHRLKSPLTLAIQASIDLSLGYLLMGRTSELSGEISFLVQCWLLVALFRFLLALFDVAVVKAPEFRPSVVALAPEAFDRARYSARIAFIWTIAKGFVYYISWTIFGMDSVTNLLMLLFNVLGLGLAIVIAHSWYPMLVERIRARNQDSRLVAVLSREVPWLLRAPVALALLGFFVATILSDLWHFAIAHDRTGIAKLFNVVSRYQIEEGEVFEGPPPELFERLCGSELGTMVHVDRDGLRNEIIEALAEWRKDSRRGLVAIVGDRGTGKRTEVDRFAQHVGRDDLPLRRKRLHEVVLTTEAMFAHLAELAQVEPTDDPELLITRLREAEGAVLVLEQAHRTFSRSVGGFEAIQNLLYIMNATSDRHFWLVTLHEPAWNYLAAIPALVDVGVFRNVVKLGPFTAPMLRELCESRVKASEHQLDYTTLMRNNLLGADPTVELERSTNTFYRLLAECSEGNPRVALRLFCRSLEYLEPRCLKVHTTSALSTDVAKGLGIEAMFTLVAIRQQDSMQVSEISSVTNQPMHSVRNLARDLESRGLIEQLDEQLYIPIEVLPMVTRTLRRRHLMHLGG